MYSKYTPGAMLKYLFFYCINTRDICIRLRAFLQNVTTAHFMCHVELEYAPTTNMLLAELGFEIWQ